MRIDYYDNRMHNNRVESELFLSCNRQSQLVEHDYVLVCRFLLLLFNIPFPLSPARLPNHTDIHSLFDKPV